MSEAAAHRIRYSVHNCKGVAGVRVPLRHFRRGIIVKKVRLNHLRAALLVAAAGLLAAVGLVIDDAIVCAVAAAA